MTAPTEAPPRREPVALLVAGAVIVAALGGAAAVWVLRSPAVAPAPPARVGVLGHLVLDDYVRWRKVGQPCESTQTGYADIRTGAQVTITDPGGTVVALATLDQGVAVAHPLYTAEFGGSVCSFSFTTTAPAGLGIYGVEVSHRGRVQVAEANLGSVELEIGK